MRRQGQILEKPMIHTYPTTGVRMSGGQGVCSCFSPGHAAAAALRGEKLPEFLQDVGGSDVCNGVSRV